MTVSFLSGPQSVHKYPVTLKWVIRGCTMYFILTDSLSSLFCFAGVCFILCMACFSAVVLFREAAMERSRVVVRVPATSANMGPGFDCLGMALSIWSEVTMERSDK